MQAFTNLAFIDFISISDFVHAALAATEIESKDRPKAKFVTVLSELIWRMFSLF